MHVAELTDLMGGALWLVLVLSALPVLVSLVVGILVGILQATTQIQDQTLSFVPKILLVFGVLLLAGPTLLDRVVEFGADAIRMIGGVFF